MDRENNDEVYSTPDADHASRRDVPVSGIHTFRSPNPGREVLEISSSDEEDAGALSDDPAVEGVASPLRRRDSVARNAEDVLVESISDSYDLTASASQQSIPEIASASRVSALRATMGVATNSDVNSVSRASFASAASVPRQSFVNTAANSSPGGGSTSVSRRPNVTTSTHVEHASATRQVGVPAKPRSSHTKPASGPKRSNIKPVAVLSPARIIAEFKRGSMSKQQAVESLIRYRMNKMLHKNSDRMYVDKDGDVRFVKGYDFGKSRDNRGRLIKRNGFTRIEREILAYQKSTHLLIPRAVFARIVREIAQTWWRGPEPVKFTVEALSALQAATEDEITRLLEISTACSYHAKRVTLRIDDMRLARFCRGRQEYEFFNIKN